MLSDQIGQDKNYKKTPLTKNYIVYGLIRKLLG